MITVLTFNSCQSVNQILTLNDLTEAQKDGNIQIVSVDSTIYYVSMFSFNDSSIYVSGTKKKFDLLTDYTGKLYFKDISYIQTRNTNTIGTLAFLGLTGLIVYYGSSAIENTSGINAAVKITYPSSGSGTGSCPFIYSWNGNEYVLEGEAFGTALGKALETKTCIILPELKPSDKKLKIKITNERPETHFFNNIKLAAIETDNDVTVYSTNNNSLQSVTKHKNISKALDINKTDITSLLKVDDNLYWESDLSSANQNSDFEDKVFVDLNIIDPTDSVSLVISAVNTNISSKVFSFLQRILGDEFANFTKAAETDDEIINVLKETLIRSALKIDIWNGKDWKYVDLIYPEANQ